MAYAIGAESDGVNNTASTTTVTAPSFTSGSGSALVAFVWYDAIAARRTVTMSTEHGTWTEGTNSNVDGSDSHLHWFYTLNTAGATGTTTATIDNTIAYPAIYIAEVTGIATTAAVLDDVGQYQLNPGTSTDAITTGNTGTLSTQPAAVIGFCLQYSNGDAMAAGTGFTSLGAKCNFGGSNFAFAEHKRVTSTSAVAATFTDSTTGGSDEFWSGVIVLKEAVGGGGISVPVAYRNLQHHGIA